MRRLRLVVGLSVFGAQIAAAFVGCGDSEKATPSQADGSTTNPDTGTTPGVDGSGGNDSQTTGDSPATPPTITISASDLNVYLGQIAEPDASGTTVSPAGETPAYQWTVTSAPPGSTIVTATLFNAGSAKPSFTPDVIGDYVLKVVVTAGTGTAEKSVTVKAFEANVVYMAHQDAGASGNSRIVSLRTVGTHSDAGPTNLNCIRSDGGDPSSVSTTDQLATFYADIWEPPPGQPTRAAYVMREFLPDGGDRSRLFAVTTDQPCPTKGAVIAELPTKTRSFPGPFGGTVTVSAHRYIQPSISPDGTRVAFLKGIDVEASTIETVGFDGASPRVLTPALASADGGLVDGGQVPGAERKQARPRWKSNTQVGFLTFPTATTWNVMLVDDADGAQPSVYMTCRHGNSGTDSRPSQFAFLPDGSVVASLRPAINDAGAPGPQDIIIYTPDATTKACTVVRNITNLSNDAGGLSFADDFSISPDGRNIAFVRFDHTKDAGANVLDDAIWTASIDGLTPPTPLPAAPSTEAVRGHGPRWVAGGAMLVWGQSNRSVTDGGGGGTAEAVVLGPAGGTGLRVIDKSSAQTTVRAIGNGTSCTIAAAGGSGVAALGATAAFIGLFLRRRRRNSDK